MRFEGTLPCRRWLVASAAGALALAAGASGPARAASHALAICDDGGPGSTKQAQPKVERFLRHLEDTGGFEADSFDGSYQTDRQGCATWVLGAKPALGVLDLPTLLHFAERWKIEPIAHVGDADASRYHVLVRKGDVEKLEGLEGKTLLSTTAEDEDFLFRIVLDGAPSPDALELRYTDRPLEGVRQVARGEVDATVVGEEAHRHLDQLDLPSELTAIHSSPKLPNLTLAALGQHTSEDGSVVKRARKALPKLCEGAGAELCDQLGVDGFTEAKESTFDELLKTYRGE